MPEKAYNKPIRQISMPGKDARLTTGRTPTKTAHSQQGKPHVTTESQTESIVEVIIRRIKHDIRHGGFAPGQRLIEAEVQQITGASRGPVREAMRRLSAEGLLEILHQKGARVRSLTRDEVEHLYDVREVLEGFAAERAALQFEDAKFRKGLVDIEKSFDKEFDGSAQTYMEYNERLHGFIVEQSRNAYLERVVRDLQIPLVMLRLYPIIDRTFIARARREHAIVIEHLLSGDGMRAGKAMRQHIRSTKETVLAKATLLTA
ncbi:GntR family transcriptional regulator [Roseiarcaceae bacterium H3SJ34-1]|uniref:GntR family transcriptional regulator n=1 Tax=Terripilifer ovatus TaxID=3032367 RepID=UPI003AB94911|nr:GntR family transcriptional regulator [Roseiarcaceae bacterium H3SJ34-1]